MSLRAAWLGLGLFALAACGNEAATSSAQSRSAPTGAAPVNGTAPIVLDQFGYIPNGEKRAFVRVARTGYDVGRAGEPANRYELVNAETGARVKGLTLARHSPREGTDPLSGDELWTLDFSSVQTPGFYQIRASDSDLTSPAFSIDARIYDRALREAFRTFYYQRAGFEKRAPYAADGYTDAASHVGPGQDTEARDFFSQSKTATARNLRGGWYDAGDFNQYTNWTAGVVRTLLMSYAENPEAWGDDFDIPESGNGRSDILDEALWGIDWLARMQRDDGAVNSVLGRAAGSPPSIAEGPSFYGPPTTAASLSVAASFAHAALVFNSTGDAALKTRASELQRRAITAFNWAAANPTVTFYNNDPRAKSEGLGAGQQEPDADTVREKRFAAATYLFALTRDERFAAARDAALKETAFLRSAYIDPYHHDAQDALDFLARDASSPPALKESLQALSAAFITRALTPGTYVPEIYAVHWGSNQTMARLGIVRMNAARISKQDKARLRDEAAAFIHYLHGANPLGLVYLSNMEKYGAEKSVSQIYHAWFKSGSRDWDEAGVSRFGPPPGFLTGGANPTYTIAMCSADQDKACDAPPPSPPAGQPPLKSYADFNDDWPLNSWQISENSTSYQADYLRLLAHFVE